MFPEKLCRWKNHADSVRVSKLETDVIGKVCVEKGFATLRKTSFFFEKNAISIKTLYVRCYLELLVNLR